KRVFPSTCCLLTDDLNTWLAPFKRKAKPRTIGDVNLEVDLRALTIKV
ncbi:hypothetical protein MNBD_GAMMA12-940, partial [hydrothermal vent metagenome]